MQAIPQRFTVDKGHHVVELTARASGVDQHECVRMREPGRNLDLAHEAFRAERSGDFGVQDLECNRATVFQIPGEVNGSHATATKFTDDLI